MGRTERRTKAAMPGALMSPALLGSGGLVYALQYRRADAAQMRHVVEATAMDSTRKHTANAPTPTRTARLAVPCPARLNIVPTAPPRKGSMAHQPGRTGSSLEHASVPPFVPAKW